MMAVPFLLLTATLFSLVFYGVGFNHLFLWVACLCSVAALSLVRPTALLTLWRTHRYAVLVALLLVLAPVIHQLFFTTVAETSLSPAWILATGPLWFLALVLADAADGGAGGLRRYLPFFLIVGLMTLLVWVAGVRFLIWGERPKDPLADPTSFGILVYLTLVPVVHWWLCQRGPEPGSARTPGSVVLLVGFLATVLMAFIVAFGTASRANVALLALAVVLWLVLGAAGKLNLRRALCIAVIGAIGLGVAGLQSRDVTTTLSQDLRSDSATQQRWLLLEAGVAVAREHAPWGVGLFGFGLEYPAIRSPQDQSSAGLYVHNDYLQLAAEGGVVLIVPLLLFVLGIFGLNLQRLRLLDKAQWCDPRAGGAIALGLCLLHACLTFVFYTLSVVLVMGVVAAWCFLPMRASSRPGAVAPRRKAPLPVLLLWGSGLGFAWLNLGYLLVDSTSLAVFSGQPGLPGTATFRESAEQQRQFARLAHTLNPDRSLPTLFFASDASNRLGANPSNEAILAAIAKHQQAIALDPRNPHSYLAVAELVTRLDASTPAGARAMAETGELLMAGLDWLPNDLELVMARFRWLEAIDQPRAAFEFLAARTLPWLERFWTRDREATLALFEVLGSRALAYEDAAAFARIKSERSRLLARPQPAPQLPGWLLRWLHQEPVAAG